MIERLSSAIQDMIRQILFGRKIYNVMVDSTQEEFMKRMGRRVSRDELLLLVKDISQSKSLEGNKEIVFKRRWMLRRLPPLMMTNRRNWENGKRLFFRLNQFNFAFFDGDLNVLPEELYQLCQHIGVDLWDSGRDYDFGSLYRFRNLKEVSILIGYSGLEWITDHFDPAKDYNICKLIDYIASYSDDKFPILPPSVTRIQFSWDLKFKNGFPSPCFGNPPPEERLNQRDKARLRHGKALNAILRKWRWGIYKELVWGIKTDQYEKLHREIKEAIEPALRQKLDASSPQARERF